MKLKHTPGPWMLINNIHYGWKTNPYSVCVKKRGVHGVAVANIPAKATVSPEEAKANAALIAAAPELLACLLTMPQSMASTEQDWWSWVDTVNEVLHKATDGAWK